MVTLHTLIPVVQLRIICCVFCYHMCSEDGNVLYDVCRDRGGRRTYVFSVLVLNCMHLAQFDSDFERHCVTVKSVAFVIFPPWCRPPSGILRTAVPDMDRETRDEYLVVLQAKDMGGHLGGLSGTTTITVKLTDVNDNPPHFRRSKHCFYLIVFPLAAFNLRVECVWVLIRLHIL